MGGLPRCRGRTSKGCCLHRMFSYSTRMKIDTYSLQAAPSKHPPSKYRPGKHQVSHALMSCLFDPNSSSDPSPDQVALSELHPGISSVHLSRRQRSTAFLPGKAQRLRPIRWHHLPVARKRAPTAGIGPLAGEAPWPLCALCVSALNSKIL
jgi:hypothetical protein